MRFTYAKNLNQKFRLLIAKFCGIFINVEKCISWNYEFACLIKFLLKVITDKHIKMRSTTKKIFRPSCSFFHGISLIWIEVTFFISSSLLFFKLFFFWNTLVIVFLFVNQVFVFFHHFDECVFNVGFNKKFTITIVYENRK